MKLGIICALKEEAKPYIDELKSGKKKQIAKLTFYIGKLFGHSAVIVESGVAKVNAAIATQILVDKFGCDFIILSGTAGALCESLHIGHTVVAREVHYHDVDAHNISDHIPFVPNAAFIPDKKFVEKAKNIDGVVIGNICCGEYFIKGAQREEIKSRLKAIAVDMESAAVAHTCFVYDIPFAVIKSVTDCPKHDSQECFEDNLAVASKNSFNVVKSVMEKSTK